MATSTKRKPLYVLTDEHRARFPEFRDRAIVLALRTEPQTDDDRAKVREAMAGMYGAAKLPVPERGIFVGSPITAAIAWVVASAAWWLRDNPKEHTKLFSRQVTEIEIMGAIPVACERAVRGGMATVLGEPVPDLGPLPKVAATDAATRTATDAATYAATYAATEAATRAAKGTASATSNAIAAFMLQCMPHWYRGWQGGNFWAGWASYLQFFRDVAKLDLPEYAVWRHAEALTLHAGPRFVHAKFWMVSDFPLRIGRDAENRPHSDTGPQLEWRDGWKSYSHRGVRVPAWLVEHPERITIEGIDRETNQEIRRIMIAKFGLAKYAAAGELVHEDEHIARRPDGSEYRSKRTLMRRRFGGDTPDLLICMVKNSTPEPDGSIKDYALRIHPECRPLFADGGEGEPQKLTCHNAVASTFGLRGEEYRPEIET